MKSKKKKKWLGWIKKRVLRTLKLIDLYWKLSTLFTELFIFQKGKALLNPFTEIFVILCCECVCVSVCLLCSHVLGQAGLCSIIHTLLTIPANFLELKSAWMSSLTRALKEKTAQNYHCCGQIIMITNEMKQDYFQKIWFTNSPNFIWLISNTRKNELMF